MAPLRTFEDLDCWKQGRKVRLEIGALIKEFPSDEKFRLADQLIRSSRSVTANIAEGYGRFHFQESIQFCRHARGSYYEMIDHLIVALDLKFITPEQFQQCKTNIGSGIALLNGFIKYLQNSKKNYGSTASEPELVYHSAPTPSPKSI